MTRSNPETDPRVIACSRYDDGRGETSRPLESSRHATALTIDHIAEVFEPMHELGGDWHDILQFADGSLMVSIGDVAGHGYEASQIKDHIRHAIRLSAQEHNSPNPWELLGFADQIVQMISPERFATACIAVLDPVAKKMHYVSAGHPHPLLVDQDGRIRKISGQLPPLGLWNVVETCPEESFSCELPDAGMLVFYTDGLLESTRNIFEGEQRLEWAARQAYAQGHARPAAFIAENVLHDGKDDDATVVTLSFRQKN